MNIPSICVPVVGKTILLFLSNLKHVMAVSDFIELRFDSLQDITSENQVGILETIMSKIPRDTRLIFTCRPVSEGGMYCLGESERAILIESYVGLYQARGFTNGHIDIEYSTLAKGSYDTGSLPLIVSYHNFSITPSTQELKGLIDKMKKHHPHVVKIATMVHTEKDIHRLYRLQISHDDTPLLVIGMGERGKSTRVIAPLLGAPWTYAASQYGGSAPGQYQLDEMYKSFSFLITNC